MPMTQGSQDTIDARPKGRKRRLLRKVFRILFVCLLVAVAIVWLRRERIADNVIADALAQRDIPATYTIETISPGKQVLSDIVIGDPDRPDLTVERIDVLITPRFGLPDVTEIRLIRPRLFGTVRDGVVSFGTLDPLIFTGGDGPFEFPALNLAIDDGRALMETDYGRVGVKLSGGGHLRGGFQGVLAAVAPDLSAGDCRGEDVTLFGNVSIDAERPEFHGPVRFAALNCEESGLAITDTGVELDLQAERNLAEYEGDIAFVAGSVSVADMAAAMRGDGSFTWHDEDLNIRYDVTASDADTPYAAVGSLTLEGRVRALENFRQVEIEGDLAGENLQMGRQLLAGLADAESASGGTLLQPLLARFESSLLRELRGSTVSASFTARRDENRSSIAIPQASLRGGSGATLLALSRGQITMGQGRGGGSSAIPFFSGNFQTGGSGLPRISGRMEQAASGALEMRMAMAEYSAGNASIALPQLRLLQGSGGRIALSGRALASGALPGGFVSGLIIPLDVTVSPGGDLAMWRGCRDLRFDRLTLANLSLGRQSITLCPQSGQPILRYGSGGLKFAAGTNALNLSGTLAQTPIRLRSGPLGVAYPGAFAARDLDIELGPQGRAQRFTITDLRADLSAESIGGDFTGADVFLASVPLDIFDASGNWRYVDDRLKIEQGDFRLEDRQENDRFEPMVARDATLSLFDNVLLADAVLREPVTGRAISDVQIAHNLGSGTGHADLNVQGITFDDALQPAPTAGQCLDSPVSAQQRPRGLTCLALGVVSNVEGTVTGTGRIDWNAVEVTSSGQFSSDSLNLAAAFGPVRGASGTVVFTDLLNLTTAPDQRIAIESVNPGIEVLDGEVLFQLRNAEVLAVQGGSWPFMGGTLRLRPVNIRFGVEEERSYILVIEGLEASRFVEQMELGNLAASGIFDGTVPIIFDAAGNGRLEAGILNSRPPGGHVSYVGELTYEDIGFFGNLAFSALRDLSYDAMTIAMDGPLTGELVTQVRFEGVGQGETAESNIVTRAIADLPIELRINIRAPFYKLINSIRALYDPSAVRDPRDLGLLADDGVILRDAVDQETVDERDAAAEEEAQRELNEALDAYEDEFENDEADIQPQESEAMQ
ncbi:intermembrane phospholipid transport protein YdbH family protein [Aurantiacibacter rhizosphaerae]|uniref:Exoprotein n=1 Tax=Aurantiacibacter rhizosphaerae TaxID=2691582 RepID=A0A844XCN9_9SPHN|nr:YdbH domain-containing protein [Aurantiacibacter rhizosphaerae]MWV28291.1 exoprotein [Aurantiacibacter rhizosphaerae]